MLARILNALLGVWLLFSAFAWPHTLAQQANAALCGIACVVFAVAGLFLEPARYLSAALGAWVFVSAFLFPTLNALTLWNNAVIGIAIFATALLAAGPEDLRRRHEVYEGT
jgi:hypothetical protein